MPAGQSQTRLRPSPRIVLAVAALGGALAFVDATIVNIALPNIRQSFAGSSFATLSWVLNAYNIVLAAFLVTAGRMADLLGRRRVFILGIEIFVAASLLCAVAPNVWTLIIFRVIQAIGGAMLVPSSQALVLNAFPPERRAHGIALLAAVAAAAAGLGPSLGGLLVSAANWRLVFLVNVPLGIVAIGLGRRRLVENRAPGRRRLPDLLGALLFALAVAALVTAVVNGSAWGWASIRVLALLVLFAVLAGVVLWRCTWHRAPVVDLSLLRARSFTVANGMTLIAAAGFYGYTLTNVIFLTQVWGYSVLSAGLALTIGPLVAMLVAGPTSLLVQRLGHRLVLFGGGVIWGAAVLWFVARVGARPDFVGEWLPGVLMLGVGAGTLFPNLSGAAVASAPGESFASATSINSVARQCGAAVGVAIVVAVIGNPAPAEVMHAFRGAWAFGAGCMFVAGAVCLLMGSLRVVASPSFTAATREMLRPVARSEQPAEPPLRPRRPIVLGAGRDRDAALPGESVADFLAGVPLFAGLSVEHRQQLIAASRTEQLESGRWLFHAGEAGDSLYVVRAGRLEVVDEDTGAVIRELGRGDAVGELALLTEQVRSAGVRAARSSDLLVVDREPFNQLLEAAPALAVALTRSLARQLRDARPSSTRIRPLAGTVALVATDPSLPLRELGVQLAEELAEYLTVALLTGAEVQAPTASESPATIYGPLLDRTEETNQLVLLCAETIDQDDPWARFSLQQADRILLVTAGGPVPEQLAGRYDLSGCDLVLHDAAEEATAGWAEVLEPIESHVLRSASLRSDLARMARRLAGRSVGIVLAGGGARGFAHIGVLEELVAAGVQIDRVGGVSMGAVIGALFAMGMDADTMDAVCFDEWVQRRPLSDFTVPRHSLIRGERFISMLNRTFGERTIESLPLSFFAGATELRSGSFVVRRWGSLREAVGLSICLPIIAPPQVRGREIFIDGSLTDNLPVSTMAELGEGPIIAVDLKASFRTPGEEAAQRERARAAATALVGAVDGDSTTTLARELGGNGSQRGMRRPSLGEVVTRVLLLGSENTSESARRHAALTIRPATAGIGLLEFHQIDAAREAGRAAAREALEHLPDTISL